MVNFAIIYLTIGVAWLGVAVALFDEEDWGQFYTLRELLTALVFITLCWPKTMWAFFEGAVIAFKRWRK